MKAYKYKKVVELVKRYQWDSGTNEEDAEEIASKIWQLFLKRKPAFHFKKIPCEFSKEGVGTFNKQRTGYIIGESKDKTCWLVLWNGQKTPHRLHKSFIKFL